MSDHSLETEQIDYYRARATEYDEWHLRTGRYDRGPEHRTQWNSELEIARQALRSLRPFGDTLELACGTGLWTSELAAGATAVTAVDAVAETIDINRSKTHGDHITYEVANVFEWQGTRQYDTVFFGFWLSHVPAARFEGFWQMIWRVLRPGGRVFFVDSLLTQDSTARDHATIEDKGIVERRLNDGRCFRIVKQFYDPDHLLRSLQGLGWEGTVKTTGAFFLYGNLTKAAGST